MIPLNFKSGWTTETVQMKMGMGLLTSKREKNTLISLIGDR